MNKISIYLSTQIPKVNIIAICVGLVYLLFGILKFSPNLSPAEDLAMNTIYRLTFGLIPPEISIIMLAVWETVVGLLLMINIYRKSVITLALIHMLCTFTPLLFFPEEIFRVTPFFSLTLVGQYIIKNIIIIGSLLTLLYRPNLNNSPNNYIE